MAFISDSKSFCFININRIGGGTVSSLLKKQVEDIQTGKSVISTMRNVLDLFPKISDYHTFTFVRCPYDWLVSMYYNINTNELHPDYIFVKDLNFYHFVQWLYEVGMNREESDFQPFYRKQTDFISVDNELKVNKIYKFEGMSNDSGTSNVLHLFLQLNLLMPRSIPMVNKSDRPLGWDNMYDSKIYKLVNHIFAEDFKNFNYKTYGC